MRISDWISDVCSSDLAPLFWMTVMPASPGDIAKYTTDGVVITSEDPALKVTHPDAVDLGSEEKEMFFVSSAHAQILLDETLELRSKANACHEIVRASCRERV